MFTTMLEYAINSYCDHESIIAYNRTNVDDKVSPCPGTVCHTALCELNLTAKASWFFWWASLSSAQHE